MNKLSAAIEDANQDAASPRTASPAALSATLVCSAECESERPAWQQLRAQCHADSPALRHEWLAVLRRAFGHTCYCIEARRNGEVVGLLPLALVSSRLFGKYLVGLPYLNAGGVISNDQDAATLLIDRAVELANDLDVRHLELRHESRWPHPALQHESAKKVHMRLELPQDEGALWRAFDPKVRNQVRKAEKLGLRAEWGRDELLDDFYAVFCINMRDLGTPVYGRRLFAAMLEGFGGDAEICIVRHERRAVAGAIVIHSRGAAEVPSASSLRKFNSLNGNMLMYWSMLRRAIERRRHTFDFGRSSVDSPTYRFKSQWGAQPHPAVWQYYVRRGSIDDMRPDNPKQQRRIAVWRKLPVWLTRLAGPMIVRGIP